MKAMNDKELTVHDSTCLAVRSMLSTLRLLRSEDEDLRVAQARLENWLAENDGRWAS